MRSPVYRNLDKPFQILSFRPIEIIVLSLTLASGSELAAIFAFNRVWSFLIVFLLAVSLFFFRRALGEFFAVRLWRFLQLPSVLSPRLMLLERRRAE